MNDSHVTTGTIAQISADGHKADRAALHLNTPTGYSIIAVPIEMAKELKLGDLVHLRLTVVIDSRIGSGRRTE